MLTVPMLHLVSGFVSLLVVALVAMTLLSGYTSIAAAVMAELFPTRVRATGIGFRTPSPSRCSAVVHLFLRETKDAPLPQ